MTDRESKLQRLRSPSFCPTELRAHNNLQATEGDFLARLKGLHDRFWSNVEKTDSCWLWTACCNQKGYGQFSIDGHRYPASRVAFFLSGQLIPEGYMILHSCDNPPCVNPEHLRSGTAKENAQDAVSRGRYRAGRNPRHKLTDRQIDEICGRVAGGETCRAIGPEYGIHWAHVAKIARRQRAQRLSTPEVSS